VSSTGALSLKKVPEKLVVIGAGVIGVELVRRIFLFFFLRQFFIRYFLYISNAIPKAPYFLPPPCSPTHPLPLPSPGIPLYWGI
jgi:hypothetical protein